MSDTGVIYLTPECKVTVRPCRYSIIITVNAPMKIRGKRIKGLFSEVDRIKGEEKTAGCFLCARYGLTL